MCLLLFYLFSTKTTTTTMRKKKKNKIHYVQYDMQDGKINPKGKKKKRNLELNYRTETII
jgi:hypothetical protein